MNMNILTEAELLQVIVADADIYCIVIDDNEEALELIPCANMLRDMPLLQGFYLVHKDAPIIHRSIIFKIEPLEYVQLLKGE